MVTSLVLMQDGTRIKVLRVVPAHKLHFKAGVQTGCLWDQNLYLTVTFRVTGSRFREKWSLCGTTWEQRNQQELIHTLTDSSERATLWAVRRRVKLENLGLVGGRTVLSLSLWPCVFGKWREIINDWSSFLFSSSSFSAQRSLWLILVKSFTFGIDISLAHRMQ